MNINISTIKIEVLSSPDPDDLGLYEFFLDYIQIGKSLNSDLVLSDNKLLNQHLLARTSPDGPVISSNEGVFYLSNGKKISGSKLHQIGDEIQISNCIFKIIESIYAPFEEDFEKLKQNYQELISSHPMAEKIIDALEKDLTKFQTKKLGT